MCSRMRVGRDCHCEGPPPPSGESYTGLHGDGDLELRLTSDNERGAFVRARRFHPSVMQLRKATLQWGQ